MKHAPYLAYQHAPHGTIRRFNRNFAGNAFQPVDQLASNVL